MKYYMLVNNASNYGFFVKDKIYPENAVTTYGYPLTTCLRTNPDDWV